MRLLKTCVRGAGSARFWRYNRESREIGLSLPAGFFLSMRREAFSSTFPRVRSTPGSPPLIPPLFDPLERYRREGEG